MLTLSLVKSNSLRLDTNRPTSWQDVISSARTLWTDKQYLVSFTASARSVMNLARRGTTLLCVRMAQNHVPLTGCHNGPRDVFAGDPGFKVTGNHSRF